MKKILLACAALFVSHTATAATLSEQDVREIVKHMISENGALIAEAMETHLINERIQAAKGLIKPETPVIGDKKALVSVIEFSDYRCGFCRRVQDTMNQLRTEYKKDVKFAFKNLPILSKESQLAAQASIAAHQQGKFWEYHGKLWENQSRLGEALFTEIATEIGLDVNRFKKDLHSDKVKALVAADRSEGQNFGAQGTPFFLINGEPISGAQPFENFKRAIDAALEEVRQ